MAGLAAGVRCAGALALAIFLAAPGPAPAADPGAAGRGPVTNLPLPRYVSIRANEANARRGPSVSDRVDWTFVRRGLPVEVTAEYGNWRRVRDSEGAGGWVHHTLLSGTRTGLVQGEAPVALRAKADAAAQIRAFAEPGVVGRLEACVAEWCEIDADGVVGWAPRAALWGVDPDEALE